jgi:hypothetical protein
LNPPERGLIQINGIFCWLVSHACPSIEDLMIGGGSSSLHSLAVGNTVSSVLSVFLHSVRGMGLDVRLPEALNPSWLSPCTATSAGSRSPAPRSGFSQSDAAGGLQLMIPHKLEEERCGKDSKSRVPHCCGGGNQRWRTPPTPLCANGTPLIRQSLNWAQFTVAVSR